MSARICAPPVSSFSVARTLSKLITVEEVESLDRTLDEHDGLVERRRPVRELQRQVSRGDTIVRTQCLRRREAGAVHKGAVLAAEVANRPQIAEFFKCKMLPGEAGVIGVAKFVGAGAAQRKAVAIENEAWWFSRPACRSTSPELGL